MKILVTGATGFLGTALVPDLLAAGYDVVCPPRAGEGAADLDRPESYGALMDGVDVVIHLAAFNPRGWSFRSLQKERVLAINADATGALGRIAAERGVQHFIFASSARVYGIGLSPYDEQSPLLAADTYGQAKIKAEVALEDAAFGTKMMLTVMRLPMATGKSGGVFGLAVRLSKYGIPLPDRLLDAQKSVIDRAVSVSSLVKTLELRQDGLVNVANSQTQTLDQVCTKVLGRRPSRFRLPSRLASRLFKLPWLGYSIEHALSDCVLDTDKFNELMKTAEKT